MKKIFLFIAILFLLSKTFAQVSYYKYEWTQINNKTKFSGIIKLKIKDTLLTGEIIWKFEAIDDANATAIQYYKGQKNKMGIEYVKGFFYAKTNDIRFEGIIKYDPYLIIGMDKYLLKLSADKLIIYGRTLSNGENNGPVYFYKKDNLRGEEEFEMLKSKIFLKTGDKAMRLSTPENSTFFIYAAAT